MLFVWYPKCSTSLKAKKWLDAHNIPYEERNIKEDNPTAAELKQWHEKSGLPLKKFFNTCGVKYREMNLSERLKSMSDAEQLALLATDGLLVKRPILVTEDGKVIPGFKAETWAAALGK